MAHSGTSASGSFVQTMVLTDIATGWTECVPVRTRDSGLVIEAIQQARSLFPFPLLGVDFDNDSAFMNELVVCWCRGQGLEVTRSRAYRKNDQAWVEQKNGAIVRRLVGYGRFVGAEATAHWPACSCGAAARQSVPAVVQAAGEDPDRGPRDQALSCASSACRPRAGSSRRERDRQRAVTGPDRSIGSGDAVYRDPRGPGRAWQTG